MEHKEMLRTKPYLRECHAFNLRQANLAVTALYDRHMKKPGSRYNSIPSLDTSGILVLYRLQTCQK